MKKDKVICIDYSRDLSDSKSLIIIVNDYMTLLPEEISILECIHHYFPNIEIKTNVKKIF
jgi:hypothetical protein